MGNETANQEAIRKKEIFEMLCKLYKLSDEVAEEAVDYLVLNFTTLKNLAQRLGFYYGIPPHRLDLTDSLYNQLIKLGTEFLASSPYWNDPERQADAGMDIFKTLVVKVDSSNWRDWMEYLQERTNSKSS